MKQHALSLLAAVVFCLTAAETTFGQTNNPYAQRTMADLEEYVKSEGWEQAAIQIETVREALKNADEATAAPIKKRLDEIETLTKAGVKKVKRGRVIRDIENALKDAKEWVDSKRSCEDALKRAQDEIDDEKNQPFLEAGDKSSWAAEMNVIRKQMLAKYQSQAIESLKKEADRAEEKWPEVKAALADAKESPAGADNAATEMSHAFDACDRAAEGLPTDDADVKKQFSRIEKLKAEFQKVYGDQKAAEALESLESSWQDRLADTDGWEKETAGPKFLDMQKTQSDAMSKLMAPKTVELISNANQWLKNRADDENFKTISGAPSIKALVKKVESARAAAWKKLETFAEAVLVEAEAAKLNQDGRDRLERLANDDLRLALEGSAKLESLQARALKLVKAFDDGAAGQAKAAQKLFEDLTASAAKNWPDMAKKFKVVAFDAAAAMKDIDSWKGKTIRFAGANNRMGWDYRPGTFEFALEQDGYHVAGKYDALVKKVVDDVAEKTGNDFSNDTYDVIAVIEGKGPITKIARSEGKVKFDDGSSADVRAQKDETVEGIRVKIVGLHLGPVAVAVGQGAVDPEGKVSIPVGAPVSSLETPKSGGGAWIGRVLTLILGVIGTIVALVKSGFNAPAAQSQLAAVKSRLTPSSITAIGGVLLAYGAYLLVRGWIVFGMLVSVAFLLAGTYLLIELLEGCRIVKPAQATKIRSRGAVIGLLLGAIAATNFVLGIVGVNLQVI